MTEFGRSSISDDLSNFSCSSVLPMTFAAPHSPRANQYTHLARMISVKTWLDSNTNDGRSPSFDAYDGMS